MTDPLALVALMARARTELDPETRSRVIEMAWEDRTPFDAIEASHGLAEADVIALMRRELKSGSFRAWRKRVTGRATKHRATAPAGMSRAHAPTQYKVRGTRKR